MGPVERDKYGIVPAGDRDEHCVRLLESAFCWDRRGLDSITSTGFAARACRNLRLPSRARSVGLSRLMNTLVSMVNRKIVRSLPESVDDGHSGPRSGWAQDLGALGAFLGAFLVAFLGALSPLGFLSG